MRKINYENNPIYNWITKNKISSNKFNQGGERPVHWKLWHWWKKLMKKQINGKIFYAHGLEELILLKYPYYPKQSTDSVKIPMAYFTELEQ